MNHPVQLRRRYRGFTMIEVLITVGIIVLLTALAIPAVMMARRIGGNTRMKSDLGLIETALNAYRDEATFGDYPRFVDPVTMSNEQGNAAWLDYSNIRGATLLCAALVGPGAAGSGNNGSWLPGDDGADGPGIRTRRIFLSGSSTPTGKVYGPYLDPTKFKVKYITTALYPNASTSISQYPTAYPVLTDINGNPILYYPALPGSPNISQNLGAANNSYAAEFKAGMTVGNQPMPMYNQFDNEGFFAVPADFRTLMGTGATPTTQLPYLLWCAGPSGQFGLLKQEVANSTVKSKTDNIANFDFPPNLRK